jgi:hypothetical protein
MFQFPGFPPAGLCVQPAVTVVPTAGFPHSDIAGSSPAHGSPTLFAVCHVLRRLLTPRHPPFAFCRLACHAETALVFDARSLRLLDAHSSYSVGKVLAISETDCLGFPLRAKPACKLSRGSRPAHSSQPMPYKYSPIRHRLSAISLRVGLTRLELVTFPLSEGCSNRLSYRPNLAFSC